MTVTTIDLKGLRQLIADGVQLVEVLPAEEYEELHLPGAISIPLKQLDAQSTRQLERSREVAVYCWDALCDMSPRAAARLDTLGFARVYDYPLGKVDWLAHGLPAEGANAGLPTAGSLAYQDAATCPIDASVADAAGAIARSPYGFVLVVGRGDVLLGRVRRSALEGLADDDRIEAIIEPGPSTIRPHVTVDELRQKLESSDVRSLVVTRPDGTLIGVVRREVVPGTGGL